MVVDRFFQFDHSDILRLLSARRHLQDERMYVALGIVHHADVIDIAVFVQVQVVDGIFFAVFMAIIANPQPSRALEGYPPGEKARLNKMML